MSPDPNALELYRKLMLARLAEEQIRKDYFQDEMKTPVHLGLGAEAIGVGVVHCLPKGTQVFGTYRNHNIFLALSEDTDGFFGELFGRENGCAKGKAGSMHMSCPDKGLIMTSAVVGTTIPVAAGAALANWYQKKNGLVTVFFGDGAVEEGVFWETMNFATLRNLRMLFVCEDNELAIHTFKKERQGFKSLREVAASFGMPYAEADGRDLNAVVGTTKSLLSQMDKGGPGFLKFDYYRLLQHVGPLGDFDAGYREKPTDFEERQDPVINYERTLLGAGFKQAQLDEVKTQIQSKIDASVAQARAAKFADSSELLTDVYSESRGPQGAQR